MRSEAKGRTEKMITPKPYPNMNGKLIQMLTHRTKPIISALALLAGLTLAGNVSAQINTLSNPGGETGSYASWTTYGNVTYNFGVVTATQSPPHTGTYTFWMFGNYNTGGNNVFSGFYQFVSAHAGQVFTADGWAYQKSTDNFTQGNAPNITPGSNMAFIEVTFQDINNATLARYRSATILSNFPVDAWIDLQVTNQLDPNTFATIGSVTNLVAPAGTVRAEYNVVFDLINGNQHGSTYWDDLSLLTTAPPPPYLTNMTPNVILATNSNFSFTAVAQSGTITNVQVTVHSVSGMVNGTTNNAVYGNTSTNLTITGLGTASTTVSYPLASNTTYSISVLVTDSNLGNATGTASFDTIRPVLVFEAEDFNYNSGQSIPTPTDGGTALYANLVGTEGIDEHKAPNNVTPLPTHFYRVSDAVVIQGAAEVSGQRQKFIDGIAAGNTNAIDEEVGYNSVGDWLNYTRTFPAGNYNIYARLATVGSGTALNLGKVTSDPSQQNQTVTNLGSFSFTDNNWNGYLYVPLKDSFGNIVSVPLSGQQTLRTTVVGNPNINFFMLVPAVGSQSPALVSSSPTGFHSFEPASQFTFTIGPASGSPILSSAIHLILNGTDVTSKLAISASGGNWISSIGIAPNTVYTAVINVTNTTSLASTFTINFDTFSQNNFMFEAEDFDFNGGQFIDNPVPSGDNTLSGSAASGTPATNSYFFYPAANFTNASVFGIDITTVGSADNANLYYRPFDNAGTEFCYDDLRQKFIDARTASGDATIGDFDVGWLNAGWWLNYTRTYPAGKYYVYARLAGGNPGGFSGTTLGLVTSGVGTSNQVTQTLGSFADPLAAGWQTWHWVPLLQTNGQQSIVSLSGVQTLKATSGGNLNMNYFMLVPAPPALSIAVSGSAVTISVSTVSGHSYKITYSTNLSSGVWQTLSTITGDGTTKTASDTASGAQRFYRAEVQ
ncbi:MAG: hypothetical protein JWR26_4214 [Pedosphaera sp.]|nr:hypothetical protein [Pedosphaera sp.]